MQTSQPIKEKKKSETSILQEGMEPIDKEFVNKLHELYKNVISFDKL